MMLCATFKIDMNQKSFLVISYRHSGLYTRMFLKNLSLAIVLFLLYFPKGGGVVIAKESKFQQQVEQTFIGRCIAL